MLNSFPRPIIFGHRGARAHAPENTLESFQLAFDQGADGIELDAKLTADGEVVVIHDGTVDRTTNGHGRVASLQLSDLRSLDAGSFFSETYRGAKIPTLNEVFEAFGEKGIINVELTNYYSPRDDLIEKVCGLIRKHSLQDYVILSSFFAYNLRKAARIMPEVPRGLLAPGGWKGIWARSFGFMFGEYQALHPNIKDVNRQQVQRVHRLNRRIHVWTVDAPDDIRRLKELDVDGLFTYDPEVAVRILR